MTSHCIEIVTYKIADPAEADRQREIARERAAALEGFAGWLALSGSTDCGERADVVVWTSHDAAKAAADVVGAAPEFADFRATITAFGGMGHYASATDGLALAPSGSGVEIGRFRPLPGVSEAALRKAHDRMVASHLSHQPGWRGQKLVRLQDGTFMDIAFASTEVQAQTICGSWAGNPDCDAFLGLIEPISMEFGTIA